MLLKWNNQNTKELKEAKNMIDEICSMKGWKKTLRNYNPEVEQRQTSGQYEKTEKYTADEGAR